MNETNSFTLDNLPALPKATTRQLVQTLASNDEDFEWYPSTSEILECVRTDIDKCYPRESPSLLDCGAGDGRVLNALTSGNKYAIEKAQALIHAMSNDIFIVGTEFTEQTLIDKKVDVVFSNPPYSDYSQWACKIIEEANASFIYLVMPQRWENDSNIEHAVEGRSASKTIIGEFDFLEADRKARAKVHVVRIDLCSRYNEWSKSPKTDPFHLWFEKHFHLAINNTEHSKHSVFNASKARVQKSIENELVEGRDLITALQSLYQHDLDFLISTYKKLEGIDAELLDELNVNLEGVRGALQQKIEGLKDIYQSQNLYGHRKSVDTIAYNTTTCWPTVSIYAQNLWTFRRLKWPHFREIIINHSRLDLSIYADDVPRF